MTRVVLSIALCLIALALGVATAILASTNRARGGDLHRRQRRCETVQRQNELRHAGIERGEWLLLHGDDSRASNAATSPQVPTFEH